MRRMSSSDIVITDDDRIVPGGCRAPARRAAKADPRDASEPRQKKAKRKTVRPRIELTPLQKLAAGGIAMTALVVSVAVAWHSGAPQRMTRSAIETMLASTAEAGFRIQEITVSGRNRTPTELIVEALGTRHGAPILSVDLQEVKDRLELIDSVKSAAVERRLPGQLHLAIAERTPVAIWQNGGQFVLVDRDGHQIPGSIAGLEDLPLVVGDGAPGNADELLTMLATEPALAERVKAAVRVGGRRWNLKLDDAQGGIEVRLPEDEPEAAWHRLAELERDHRLSGRQISMIDLRVPDRLVMRAERAAVQEPGKRKDNGA
ncbi:MAG: cell division protein FtsQ/DivIB [Solirubrobacterales bacterium]